MGDYPELSVNVITNVLISERERHESQKRRRDDGSREPEGWQGAGAALQPSVASFEDGGRGHAPRNAGGL